MPDEIDELLRELDGAGFELESRAAAAIRRLREERDKLSRIYEHIAARYEQGCDHGGLLINLFSLVETGEHFQSASDAERVRLASEAEKLREERDAARHNSLTESADRDRLAERVRELEQELDAARKTPVKALEAENEALWRILRELDSDGTMEERAKLRRK